MIQEGFQPPMATTEEPEQATLLGTVGESLRLENGVEITVLRISNGVVKLGITAPLHLRVRTAEAYNHLQQRLES